MSTILKALRRLEQDKAREQSQSLEESVAAKASARRPGAGWRLALVTLCVVLGAGSGALTTWFWLPRHEGGPETAPVAAGEPLVAAPTPRQPEPERQPEVVFTPAPATPPAIAEPPPAIAEPPAAIAEPPPPEAPAAVTLPPREAARDVVRRRVPQLIVRRTVWHPDSERRAAVVQVAGHPEPLRVGEGDSIESLTVVEITPSGVSFDNGGVQLYKRVGAGW